MTTAKRLDRSKFGVVKVFNKSLCFGLEWVNSKTEIFTLLFYLECEQELEVIGNTHTTILSFQEDLVREIKFRAWDGENIIDDVTPYFTGEGILCVGKAGYDRTAYDIRTSIDCITVNIMQYTGLKDKNGAEAYICNIAKDEFGNVIEITEDYVLLGNLQIIQFEIIGNKYENPELLEG